VEAREKIGTIDILVNNAGVGAATPLVDLSDRDIDLNLDINLRATIMLTREVLRGMLTGDGGAIINIASQAAKRGFANISHYSASKAGVLGFTTSLAAEVGPKVRVNSISPGAVLTAMMENNIRKLQDEKGLSREGAMANWTAQTPMGRMQTPDDIANAVLFLASDAASEITGEGMNVSGGSTTN
jgi:NAD(P)-dependent dehydrogenase (short-subunit alcohol dehydrogenase family)